MPLATRPLVLATLLCAAPIFTASRQVRAAEPTKQECIDANERSGPLRKSGKLREARASLLRCSAQSCPGVVRDDCIAGATQLEQAMPTIVFVAQDGSGNEILAVTVTVDAQPLADKLGGTALEVDPGEHVFVFTAKGMPTAEKRLVIHEGEKNRRERIQLGAPGAAPSPAQPDGPTPPPPVRPHEGGGAWPLQKKVALVVGGVGVVGIGVGVVFGLLAGSSWKQAQTDCGTWCSTTSSAQSEADSAHSQATIANIVFGVGAAAAVTGAVLWVLAPSETAAAATRVTPFVGPSAAGLAATGRFQ